MQFGLGHWNLARFSKEPLASLSPSVSLAACRGTNATELTSTRCATIHHRSREVSTDSENRLPRSPNERTKRFTAVGISHLTLSYSLSLSAAYTTFFFSFLFFISFFR